MAVSDNGFQQMSFVNSIATTKGGRHVDYVSKMIEGNVAEVGGWAGGKQGCQGGRTPCQTLTFKWGRQGCQVKRIYLPQGFFFLLPRLFWYFWGGWVGVIFISYEGAGNPGWEN